MSSPACVLGTKLTSRFDLLSHLASPSWAPLRLYMTDFSASASLTSVISRAASASFLSAVELELDLPSSQRPFPSQPLCQRVQWLSLSLALETPCPSLLTSALHQLTTLLSSWSGLSRRSPTSLSDPSSCRSTLSPLDAASVYYMTSCRHSTLV